MPDNVDPVLQAIEAREFARGVIDMIEGEIADWPAEARSRVWERLIGTHPEIAAKIAARHNSPDVEKAMTDAGARLFEQVTMPFGRHQGTAIKDLPLDYVSRLIDPSAFLTKLKAYAKSSYFLAKGAGDR